MTSSTGLLLVNLGTPDDPGVPAVRRYLRQFLSDPCVIDIHPLARAALVNLIIVPFRAPRSAAAYRTIWTPEGSPLLVHGLELEARVADELADVPVVLGMRYGKPSLATAMGRLREQGCDTVVVLPLYPQYATSSTESSLLEVRRVASELPDPPVLREIGAFHDDAGFLEAFVAVGREALADFEPDHVLFSYHGLPERHLRRLDPEGACFVDEEHSCCARLENARRGCYRAQCVATSEGLRQGLGLERERCSTTFQSRLGRTPWIRPYTDLELVALAERGVRRLAVFCPSFVADCLETLEEIRDRGAAAFRAAGGEELRLVPSLNGSSVWVRAVADLVRPYLG